MEKGTAVKCRFVIVCIVSGLLFGWGGTAQIHCRVLEWNEEAELKLEASPLDVVTSADGEWLFVLTPDQLLVYSLPENKLLKQIPLEGRFDRVAHSSKDNTLVLSSSSSNNIRFIELELVHEFDVSGLPFKGPEDAAVTIAVFGDYQ